MPFVLFDLPVYFFFSDRAEKFVAFREVLTAEEAVVCRKRAWVGAFENKMAAVRDKRLFRSCVTAPKKEYYRFLTLVEQGNGAVGEYFPALCAVASRRTVADGEDRV